MLGITRDITEQKLLNEAISASNEFNQQIINCAHEGIIVYGPDLRYQVWNPFMEEMTGYRKDDVLGRLPLELFPFLEETGVIRRLEKVLKGESVDDVTFATKLKDITRWTTDTCVPLRNKAGAIIGVIGIVRDITESKNNELALKEKEDLFRESQQAAMVGSYIVDFATGTWESSEALDIFFGIDRSYPRTIQGWLDIVHPEDRNMMGSYLREHVLTNHLPFDKDYRIVRKADGSQRWVLGLGKLRDGAEGKPTSMVGTIQDITERKLAEQELKHSHDLMRYIIKHNTSALAVHDKDLKYLFVSERYLHEYKVKDKDIIGKHHYDVFPDLPQKWRDVHQKALAGIISRAEVDRYDKEDGSVEWTTWECRPWYEADGNVGGIALYTEVITERIKAEEQRRLLQQQLHQSQKMEAIGQLAGGVAHDFNNILTVISTCCFLLEQDQSINVEQRSLLTEIKKSSEKAAQLTQGLLAFSRKQPLMMKQENLNDVVQHVQRFVARIIGEDIVFRTECCGTTLPVLADRGQIEQVLINLATNARDAMPGGGLFSIKTELIDVTAPVTDFQGQTVPPGSYALLTVSDNGIGIDRHHLHRIFEPFFTTKEVGKGSGLGMAIIYGIVKQHHGCIDLSSEVGQGTTFLIYLPIQETNDTPVTDKAEPMPPVGGNETILFAEDDVSVRTLITNLLTGHGYEVILADDGADAIEKFRRNHERIGLILMDMIMPKKNGREAYDEVCRIKPDIKVLFISGYTAEFMENRGVSGKEVELLLKPVPPADLLQKIREMLDA